MKSIGRMAAILGLLLAAAVLAGCSATSAVWTGKRVMAVRTQTSDMVSLSCDEFTGGVTYTFRVKEEHRLQIDARVEMTEGQLMVVIRQEDQEPLFMETLDAGREFSVGLPRFGRYQISLVATGFQGSYVFSWAKDGIPAA